jgi:hypothetical protein
MLQTGNYDVLEFSMPVEGMNQNISPDILPPSFAQWLENIIARPLGEGQVRFGTEHIASLPNPEAVILKQFPFVKPDGSKQLLLYVQEYRHDATAKDFVSSYQDNAFRFSFTTTFSNAARYVKDTAIKVEYALNGHRTLYDEIASLTVSGNSVTIALRQNAFPAQAVITSVSFATGAIYCYDFARSAFSPALRQNLCIACIPRYATFMGKLIICNGVDRVLSWDGESLEEVYDFVEEQISDVAGLDFLKSPHLKTRQFSFAVSPDFDLNNYKTGNLVKITVNGITAQVKIASQNLRKRTLTITADTDLPDFVQDFMAGSAPLLLGDCPHKDSLKLIRHRLLGVYCKGNKLHCKVADKDKMRIRVDGETTACTAKGLAPGVYSRIMRTLRDSEQSFYRKFLYKVQEDTAQKHALIDKVLADYKHERAEYHRRHGATGATASMTSAADAPKAKEKPWFGQKPGQGYLFSDEQMTAEDVETLRRYIGLCGYMAVKPPGDLNTQIFYQVWPPKFSFLFVAHDRLWALGEGAAGLDYRAPLEALRVYYASKPNTVTGWFNALTKTVPSLDLSAKHGEPDNLEAICLIGNSIAFMGRKKTQVYQGQNPLPLNEGGDFAYAAILPTGILHGDLLVELANDVFFITPSGLQSFSTLNVAKQFAATSLDAVNPLIQQYAASLTASNISYRSCQSFKHEAGTLAGFKIGNNKVLVSLFSTTLYSWGVFSGDFETATSFLTFGNRLYLSLHNKIYGYADGCDGSPPAYADRDGKGLIPFSWTLPVISGASVHLKGRVFANKRYEVQMDYPSSFTLRQGINPRQENQVNIGISGDLPQSYGIHSPCRFEVRGDLLQSIPLTADQDPTQDSLGFRFGQPFGFFKDRLKFTASKFWLSLSGYTKDGPLVFKKIKLYGIIERR